MKGTHVACFMLMKQDKTQLKNEKAYNKSQSLVYSAFSYTVLLV